ncbi:protein NETWORKED 4A-like isoform X1 [Rosa rugosa]|uniref:protein NETWORKED 4A-like isoform X1 n=2 Tax=Rosa rugosa TaxID=74645 RepID=UPI002B4033B4|nr:protein NETWORKED 4A-like isoform X1 [Rosa rugosa]XP_062014937.1 protein NETWORKED 4A-like isoform X1 [Rosa rugosa]
MASPLVQSNKSMKRLESKKSHSWWWDSHISPKNSKWLAENLEEMDRCIKRMLKLVEEDGDSFAKKAEMYYQKRPELISHVEDFYRLYRSLAERYDHVTGELRKNVTSDLQSMSSCISDGGSELPSAWSSPDLQSQRLSRRKSGPRAAGFDFFLGPSGNSSDNYQKEGEESSSLTDSEPESDDDDSSVNNYSGVLSNGGDQGQQKKIIQLEIELREAREKLRLQEENADSPLRGSKNEKSEEFSAKIAEYAQELMIANEKLQASEEQISRLNIELKRYKSSENGNAFEAGLESSEHKEVKRHESEPDMEVNEAFETPRSGEVQDPDNKIEALVEELRITKDRLQHSQKEIASLRQELESNKASRLNHEQESNKASEKIHLLQGQLESAKKDIATWKTKLNSEKREVSKLQERIARLKTSLSDRDHEVMDLKIAVSDAEEKIFPEKAQVKAEISRLYSERTQLEEQIRDWESRGRSLEDEIRMIKAGKAEMEERLTSEIEQLKAEILEIGNHIGNLHKALDAMKAEGDELSTKVVTLKAEVSYRDDKINEMDIQLQQLHKEQVELVSGAEGAWKLVEELTARTKELEEEIQRQRVMILEGAEEKREAIRQLCFSLEHYRNGYHRLRQACMGHKRVPVLAS